jgi:hypothetical protein
VPPGFPRRVFTLSEKMGHGIGDHPPDKIVMREVAAGEKAKNRSCNPGNSGSPAHPLSIGRLPGGVESMQRTTLIRSAKGDRYPMLPWIGTLKGDQGAEARHSAVLSDGAG